MRFRRRHRLYLVKTKDACDQLAFLRFARDNGAFGDRIFPDIQAELSFARLLVRAMTMEAIIGENRPDIPIITDLLRPQCRKREEEPEKATLNGEKAVLLFHANPGAWHRTLLTEESELINNSNCNRSVMAVGRATPYALGNCGPRRRARSDAPYPPLLKHYLKLMGRFLKTMMCWRGRISMV